jgi:hypothetical protein
MGNVHVHRIGLGPRAIFCLMALVLGATHGEVATLIAIGAILLVLLDVD